MNTVRTYSGNDVDLLNPDPRTIAIEDIAHHLAKLDRYNGASHFPYSVGQHSLLVSDLLPKQLKLTGLLHDATEAYLGDVVSPLKALLPEYRKIESNVYQAVCKAFSIPYPRSKCIKQADRAIMAVEMEQVVMWPDLSKRPDLPPAPENVKITPMRWQDVKEAFLERFRSLHQERRLGR